MRVPNREDLHLGSWTYLICTFFDRESVFVVFKKKLVDAELTVPTTVRRSTVQVVGS